MGTADLDDFAIHHHHGHAKKVVGRHAVFQAVGAAGIHRDVAGNGAGKLTGGIGRIEEAAFGDIAADGKIGDAGLDPNETVVVIGFQHLVHAGNPDDDGIGGGKRATCQRGAGTARNDRQAHFAADAQNRGNLVRAAWQAHGQRRAAIGGQRIAFVGKRLFRIVDNAILADRGLKRCDDFGFARQDRAIGFRHLDERHHALLTVVTKPEWRNGK